MKGSEKAIIFDEEIEAEGLKQLEALEEMENPKKKITIGLYPKTHKTFKIMAAVKNISLEKTASQYIEDEVMNLDIVKYVEDAINKEEDELDVEYYNHQEEIESMEEQVYPRKRVTIKLSSEAHRRLRVVAGAQGRSLEKCASNIVEEKINNVDIVKMVADEFN